MSATWQSADLPEPGRVTALGWALVVLRCMVLGPLVFGGLALLLLVRLFERPVCGADRPVSPYITQAVCRTALLVLGLKYTRRGQPMRGMGAMVANHASWLDIFVLNAPARVYFVSKAEVAGWPGIGWLARATGTVFIRRNAREASAQRDVFETRLRAGHRLLFFPEGTSTDGQRVLPFKPTLFAAFFAKGLQAGMQVQPVSVIYTAPAGADARVYGWWGDMEFGQHFVQVLSRWRQGGVTVVFHAPVQVAEFASRKALAAWCEAMVRAGFDSGGAAI